MSKNIYNYPSKYVLRYGNSLDSLVAFMDEVELWTAREEREEKERAIDKDKVFRDCFACEHSRYDLKSDPDILCCVLHDKKYVKKDFCCDDFVYWDHKIK